MSDPVGLPTFVVGHVVRTTNAAELDTATALVPGVWARTIANAELLAWSGRVGGDLFAVYYDYESDQSGEYSLLVGVGADSIADIPAGITCVRISDDKRDVFRAEGQMPAAVVEAWGRVWAASADGVLPRLFTTDLEVHHSDGSTELLIAVS